MTNMPPPVRLAPAMMHIESLSDAELVAGCRQGHATAWDTLIGRYERLVYTVPLRYGLSQPEADDVYQSVWIALLRHLPNLNQPERVAAWLVTTARRESWERRRGADFERTYSVDPAEMPEPADPWFSSASPEEIVARFDDHRRLHDAMRLLQERCRQLLHLLYTDPDRPAYSVIAERLNMPVSSIGPTRARCLQRLKELLE
jgi:RNA polymerase sigma factor (sigma-70 family)